MKFLLKLLLWLIVLVVIAGAILAATISYTASCPQVTEQAATDNTMRSARYYCYGGSDVVHIENKPIPSFGENELLIKVEAAAVNPLDTHYMKGSPYILRLLSSGIGKPKDPRMGVDFAGRVVEVGSKVSKFKVGDIVFGGGDGAFSDYLVKNQDGAVAKMPLGMRTNEAAALPIAGVTALQALRDAGQAEKGQEVLINGASGGVGTYAVQIAKAYGLKVTGVSSQRNHPLIRSLGATTQIDYKTTNYTEGDKKYDLIVDMVGNHTPKDNAKVLKPGGRLVSVGGPKGNWVAPFENMVKAKIAQSSVDGELITLFAKLNQEDLNELKSLVEARSLTARIDRTYGLHELKEAFDYSLSQRAKGKIVIDMNREE